MAVTASLVYNSKSRQRYLCTQDGTAGTTVGFSTTGDGAPFGYADIRTAALVVGKSLLLQLAMCFANGYGQIAPNTSSVAIARALWMSDWSGVTPGTVRATPTAIARITGRSGINPSSWAVDGASLTSTVTAPGLQVTAPATASTAYLDILTPGQIGA